MSLLSRIFRGRRYEAELDQELAFHIGETADELIAQGMEPEAAYLEARRRFGNRTGTAESTREADSVPWLESLLGDLRYAARALRRSPGFALVAVLSLALGIGANTAIFSLINAVALRSLPVDRPEQLVRVIRGERQGIFTNPLWEQIRDRATYFDGAFAYNETQFNLADGGPRREVAGNQVSGAFFRTLGVSQVAGRLITPDDDTRGCAPVAVLSDGFSRREFGSPTAAVGKPLLVSGVTFTVIGVAEPGFRGITVGRPSEVYVPLCTIEALERTPGYLDHRSSWYLQLMARLPDSLTLEAAQSRLDALTAGINEATLPQRWRPEHHAEYLNARLGIEPSPAGRSEVRNDYGGPLVMLMVIVGVVLLIACANVAHLLLARAAARQREMAIRMAIGAGKSRLVRQLLTESLLLSGLGAAVGILFANWASAALVRMIAVQGEAVWLDLTPDWRVLGFTIGVAILTGVLFGLAPAWRATRVDPQAAMKAQGRGVTEHRGRFGLGRTLVVGQVALSLVLLVSAGLLLRSFMALNSVDAGFDREGILRVSMDYGSTGFDLPRRQTENRLVLERLRAMPGVTEASASLLTPISGSGWNEEMVVEGYTPANENDNAVWHNAVSEGYFAVMGIELLEGRDIGRADGEAAPPVAVVSASMARRFYPGRSAVGQVYRTRNRDSLSPPVTIVGVVEDTKYSRMEEEMEPAVYRPLYQAEWWSSTMNYELRFAGQQADIMRGVIAVAAQSSRSIGLTSMMLDEQVALTLRRPRLLALLSGFFGLLAVGLAVIGLYGTMAYGVARRRNEIGVRLALGARRERVLGMILGEAGWLVGIGVALGVGASLAATRIMNGFLYGLRNTDSVTYIVAGSLLALAALLAAAIPAWKAARLDPMSTLRED